MAFLKKLETYSAPEEVNQPSKVMSGSWWWRLGRLMLLLFPLQPSLFPTPARVIDLVVVPIEQQIGQERPQVMEAWRVRHPWLAPLRRLWSVTGLQ